MSEYQSHFSKLDHLVNINHQLVREAMVRAMTTGLSGTVHGEAAHQVLGNRLNEMSKDVDAAIDEVLSTYILNTGVFQHIPRTVFTEKGMDGLWARASAMQEELIAIRKALPDAVRWITEREVTLVNLLPHQRGDSDTMRREALVTYITPALSMQFLRIDCDGAVRYIDDQGESRLFFYLGQGQPPFVSPMIATLLASLVAIVLPIISWHPAPKLKTEE